MIKVSGTSLSQQLSKLMGERLRNPRAGPQFKASMEDNTCAAIKKGASVPEEVVIGDEFFDVKSPSDCCINCSKESIELAQKAFKDDPSLVNLMVDKTFSGYLNDRIAAWRRVVASCITNGIACPAFCGSITYFDSYRRASLPANLTQAQRDFFGAHS